MTTVLTPHANGVAGPTLSDGVRGLDKAPTGVAGLDEVLRGGFPRGRPTLLCGGAGCGKTLLAMEFLCRGALDHGEPGVFIAFEEKAAELAANMASLGYDLPRLQADGLLIVDFVPLDPEAMVETGAYDLEGLFLRIASSVDEIGAQRIAFDTAEVLFGALKDTAIVRAELKRLFTWTKERALTAVITAERGDEGRISRNGIDEYVSDCVILLDHRITDERSTRRLRVLKYRGSAHGTDEYPFLISDKGFVVLPITSLGLGQRALSTRVSTGIERLDATLSGGLYEGSSVLISGTAGTGKTTFAAHFADASCRQGSRTLFISYEESASQLQRNTASVGIDLARWVDQGLLRIEALRPTLYGIEAHLMWLEQLLDEFKPAAIVVDPVTSFLRAGSRSQTASMLLREIDLLKTRGITAFFTALTHTGGSTEATEVEISSLIDTWLLTETDENNGERNRVLYIIKSRGMAHSNQLAEFQITDHGIDLLEPYVGPAGVLTGSARILQDLADRADGADRVSDLEEHELSFKQHSAQIEAQVAALHAGLAAERTALERFRHSQSAHQQLTTVRRNAMGAHRWSSAGGHPGTALNGQGADKGGGTS